MNILVIPGSFPSPHYPFGGIFFVNLLLQLNRWARRIVVVSPLPHTPWPLSRFKRYARYHATPFHYDWQGLEVYRPRYFHLPAPHHLWQHCRAVSESIRPLCESLHRRHGFDVVIGYTFVAPAHAAVCVAAQLGIKSVAWAIGSDVNSIPHDSPNNMNLFRHNVHHADLILTESDALRRKIVSLCPDASHAHTYYKGIDLNGLRELQDRRTLRARLGLAPDRIYLLSAGLMMKDKGIYEFYEAFKRLLPEWPQLSALWFGEGPEWQAIRAQVAADGLADRFSVMLDVPRPALLEYMQAADMLVFPSYAEGLANVVMEALAAGLSVVTTDVGGHREVIRTGVSGLLIPPRGVDAVVASVRRLLKNPAEAGLMAANGRRFILDYFDVEKNAPIAMDIFRRLISDDPASAPQAACAKMEAGRLPIDLLEGNTPTSRRLVGESA